jgi:hypothetical protein
MLLPGIWQTVQTVTGTYSLSMPGFYPFVRSDSITMASMAGFDSILILLGHLASKAMT